MPARPLVASLVEEPYRHGGQHEQRIYDWQVGHDGCEQNQRAAGMDSVDDQARMEHRRDYQCLHRNPEVDRLVRFQHLRGKAEGQGLWCEGNARQYREGLRLLYEEGQLHIATSEPVKQQPVMVHHDTDVEGKHYPIDIPEKANDILMKEATLPDDVLWSPFSTSQKGCEDTAILKPDSHLYAAVLQL